MPVPPETGRGELCLNPGHLRASSISLALHSTFFALYPVTVYQDSNIIKFLICRESIFQIISGLDRLCEIIKISIGIGGILDF